MRILIASILCLIVMSGCQKEVTITPQQPNVIVNPRPDVIVVPARPQPRPGVHIDINSRRWCNRCGVWVDIHAPHHCH